MLAEPTHEAVALIAAYSPLVEIGAGDGAWAQLLRDAGATVAAFDIRPRGPGVIRGDHKSAAKSGSTLLAIWPPDGDAVQEWIRAAPWPAVILVACPRRIDPGPCLADYVLVGSMTLGSRKGTCRLGVMKRRPRPVGARV